MWVLIDEIACGKSSITCVLLGKQKNICGEVGHKNSLLMHSLVTFPFSIPLTFKFFFDFDQSILRA